MNKTKRVFSFKKKNTVHDTGNKFYIGDCPLKIPHINLPQYPPEIEKKN